MMAVSSIRVLMTRKRPTLAVIVCSCRLIGERSFRAQPKLQMLEDQTQLQKAWVVVRPVANISNCGKCRSYLVSCPHNDWE